MNHDSAPQPSPGSVPHVAKRVWSAPSLKALKVDQTELNNGYWAEVLGMNGCGAYDANASTNVCSVAT